MGLEEAFDKIKIAYDKIERMRQYCAELSDTTYIVGAPVLKPRNMQQAVDILEKLKTDKDDLEDTIAMYTKRHNPKLIRRVDQLFNEIMGENNGIQTQSL